MTNTKRCPECGGADLKPAGDRVLRCADCGQEVVYKTPWQIVVLTWAGLAAILGGGGFLLGKSLFHWSSPALWLAIVFPVIAILSYLISRQLRAPQKVSLKTP
jgi:DNA-directed RNA polymerase subunit RPC12/RpoP